MTSTITAAAPLRPLEMFGIDTLLDDDERDIAATVRRFVDSRLRPDIGEWFERGELPGREPCRSGAHSPGTPLFVNPRWRAGSAKAAAAHRDR